MAPVRRSRLTVTVTTVPPPTRPVSALDRWVAGHLPAGAAVLNIGAGRNLSGELPRTRRRAGRLVGVDPSERVLANDSLDERHQATLQQFAPGHPSVFDAAFSVFVLEHVTDPWSFTTACAEVLKPRGSLFGLTVNKWHYFGLSTWAATRLGVSEWLLPRLRSPAELDAYHFPTAYRMNTIRTMSGLLAAAGFSGVEFRMWDLPPMYTPYLPERLHGLADAWSTGAYRLVQPNLMGHLTFRATR